MLFTTLSRVPNSNLAGSAHLGALFVFVYYSDPVCFSLRQTHVSHTSIVLCEEESKGMGRQRSRAVIVLYSLRRWKWLLLRSMAPSSRMGQLAAGSCQVWQTRLPGTRVAALSKYLLE